MRFTGFSSSAGLQNHTRCYFYGTQGGWFTVAGKIRRFVRVSLTWDPQRAVYRPAIKRCPFGAELARIAGLEKAIATDKEDGGCGKEEGYENCGKEDGGAGLKFLVTGKGALQDDDF
jgi:hypothetical protein